MRVEVVECLRQFPGVGGRRPGDWVQAGGGAQVIGTYEHRDHLPVTSHVDVGGWADACYQDLEK